MTSTPGMPPVHPAADLFPMMSDDELEVLAEDIKNNGLLTPVTYWMDPETKINYLLDGRNRAAASIAAGRGMPSGVRQEAREPYDFVLSANVHRRHLTAAQKREVIAKLLKARPERSDRATAKDVGADHKTVGNVREELTGRGEIPHVDAVVDTKGRKQPKRKPLDAHRLGAEPTGATINGLPIKRVVERTEEVQRWMKDADEHLLRLFSHLDAGRDNGFLTSEVLREFACMLRVRADHIERVLDGPDEPDGPPASVHSVVVFDARIGRQRHNTKVEYMPGGWLGSGDGTRPKVCATQLQGVHDDPAVWKITRRSGNLIKTGYYCERHRSRVEEDLGQPVAVPSAETDLVDNVNEVHEPPTRVKLSGGYVSVGEGVEFQDFPRKRWEPAKVTKITADGDGGVEVRVAAGGTLHTPYLAKLRRKAVKRTKRSTS